MSTEGRGRESYPNDRARTFEPLKADQQLGFGFDVPVEAEPVRAQASRRPRARREPTGETLPPWFRDALPKTEQNTAEEKADEAEQAELPVWRIAALVAEVRNRIESAFADLRVRGEISNLRSAPSGHLYFTLKDGDTQLSAVMFRRAASLLRFRPEDGLEVLLGGRVSVYEQRGQMQLIADSLEPIGAGSLQVAFEQLKRKLAAEGLFAADRKRLLPLYPHCVGIVTSPTGAVIRDFLNVAGRRHAKLDVLLYPATVQGGLAAAEIAAGIRYFNEARNVDVIVIARGGGSLEDLAPFNSEAVARAVADSVLPVVSAVGHETDFTIADFVADLRAPTPSAAAELITSAQHRIAEQIELLDARLGRATRLLLALAQRRYAGLAVATAAAQLHGALGRRAQWVDEQRFRLENAQAARLRSACDRVQRATAALARLDATQQMSVMRERLAGLRQRLESASAQRLEGAGQRCSAVRERFDAINPVVPLERKNVERTALHARLSRAVRGRLIRASSQHAAASRSLESMSPLAVLSRGYALVFSADGGLLKSVAQVREGEAIDVRLAEGALAAIVSGKSPGKKEKA